MSRTKNFVVSSTITNFRGERHLERPFPSSVSPVFLLYEIGHPDRPLEENLETARACTLSIMASRTVALLKEEAVSSDRSEKESQFEALALNKGSGKYLIELGFVDCGKGARTNLFDRDLSDK